MLNLNCDANQVSCLVIEILRKILYKRLVAINFYPVRWRSFLKNGFNWRDSFFFSFKLRIWSVPKWDWKFHLNFSQCSKMNIFFRFVTFDVARDRFLVDCHAIIRAPKDLVLLLSAAHFSLFSILLISQFVVVDRFSFQSRLVNS